MNINSTYQNDKYLVNNISILKYKPDSSYKLLLSKITINKSALYDKLGNIDSILTKGHFEINKFKIHVDNTEKLIVEIRIDENRPGKQLYLYYINKKNILLIIESDFENPNGLVYLLKNAELKNTILNLLKSDEFILNSQKDTTTVIFNAPEVIDEIITE